MGETNLKNYLKKVDTLLNDGASTEALAHTRHILTQYPKNAHAYRVLGRILVQQGQWAEASEVFRRLLGALPTDFVAHQQLSLVYDKLGQPEQALFHLERAFDQQPNDKAIIAQLRDMLARVRGAKVDKIQLTAGAVANQYLNSNLPEQAIELLQKAIAKMPDRADLTLQLARAQWSAGRAEEAAESALRVLQQFPYAVPANRVMAEFWLEKERPNDARDFLLRIEEVDPYLALRIVNGDAPDNAYMADELDYKRVAQRELTTASPDWLSALGADADAALVSDDAEDLSWLGAGETSADDAEDLSWLEGIADAPAPRKKVTDSLPNLLDDDLAVSGSGSEQADDDLSWLDSLTDDAPAGAGFASKDESFTGGLPPEVMKRIEAMRDASNEGTVITTGTPQERAASSFTDILGSVDEQDIIPVRGSSTSTPTGLTDLFAQMHEPSESDAQDDDLSWMDDLNDFEEPDFAPPSEASFSDVDFASEPDFFSEGMTTEEPARSPMSPLKERTPTGFTDFLDSETGEFMAVEDPNADFGAPNDDEARLPSSLSQDPLAWMQDTDIEYDASVQSDYDIAYASFADEETTLADHEEDPLAWMRTADVELVQEEASLEEKPQTDPLAWMKEAGIEFVDDEDEAVAPAVARDVLTEGLGTMSDTPDDWERDDAQPDWLSETDDDAPDIAPRELDWLKTDTGEFQGTGWEAELEAKPTTEVDDAAWLQDLGDATDEDGLLEGDFADEADPLAWMSDYEDVELVETADTVEAVGEDVAWLSELADDDSPVSLGADLPTTDESAWLEVDELDAIDDDDEGETTAGESLIWGEGLADEADQDLPMLDDEAFDADTAPNEGFVWNPQEDVVLTEDEHADFDFDEFDFAEEGAQEGEFDFELSSEAALGSLDEFGDFDEFDFAEEGAQEGDSFGFDVSAQGELGDFDEFDFAEEGAQEGDNFGFDFDSDEITAGEPSWLSRVSTEGETALSEDEADALFAYDTFDDEPLPYDDTMTDEGATATAYAEGTPIELDWLTSATESDMEADFAPTSGNFDDFGYDDDLIDDYSQDEFAYEQERTLTQVIDDAELGEMVSDELELAETSNAPDWLNAMVPGLDVDYSARGDAPLDEGFSEEARAHRSRTLKEFTAVNEGFDWLTDLVRYETNNLEVVPPPPAPEPLSVSFAPAPAPSAPSAQGAVRRFVFSRLPAWLQPKSAAPAQEADDDFGDFDDADFDFDDFDDNKK
jgi:tetratricopeptide (TPR) repeat protein